MGWLWLALVGTVLAQDPLDDDPVEPGLDPVPAPAAAPAKDPSEPQPTDGRDVFQLSVGPVFRTDRGRPVAFKGGVALSLEMPVVWRFNLRFDAASPFDAAGELRVRGWIVSAIFARPSPWVMASVIPEIMSPALVATIVAPRIRSVPFLTWTRTNPSVSPSRMARSTCSNSFV